MRFTRTIDLKADAKRVMLKKFPGCEKQFEEMWRIKMSDKNYVVPEGMLAAVIAYMGWDEPNEDQCANRIGVEVRRILEVAIRWQDSHLPNDRLVNPIGQTAESYNQGYAKAIADLRRMYLAPEPQVPEEINDLLYRPDSTFSSHNKDVIEAYRRGKAGH
jgi:hypothetical protein